MIPTTDRLRDELSLFSDVGTDAPVVHEDSRHVKVILYRNGVKLSLHFDKHTGSVVQSSNETDPVTRYPSFRAVLASKAFADLRTWAGSQHRILRSSGDEALLLPVSGSMTIDTENIDVSLDNIDHFLTAIRGEGECLRTLLIDGPAGVGKTILIERLALRRSRSFMQVQAPLLLHVQSRGRVLSFLQDLIAYSLQTMRVQVTYDQLPVLVRHGLVQLAIDGFDELGDPEGYDLAWAQLAQTIEDIEGQGALILAGRETFIGRERLLKAIPRLGWAHHRLGVLSLKAVDPNDAKRWLRNRDWQEHEIARAEKWGLFEQGSYALRPFFLSQLAGLVKDGEGASGKNTEFLATPPLIHLMKAMITREAGKFGDRVQSVMNQEQREQFILQVLVEAARDIAENQTESVDEEMLLWFVEVVLGDGCDDTIKRLLKNRILVLAFLVNDDRHGYRRFAHSEFYNFFLSHSAINAVRDKEVPKFLRRTILGADFLVSFGTVFESIPSVQAQTFLKVGQDLLSKASNLDRSGRNIAALLLAALPVSDLPNGVGIVGANVDDAVIRGTAQFAHIADSSINQFDLRGADISGVSFDSVGVSTLIADETTRLSSSFPDVGWIQLVSERSLDKTLDGARAIDWIDRHGRRPMNVDGSIVPVEVKDHDLYKLLERACRVMLRHHWIRSPGDDREALLVRAPCWHELETLLINWNLLTKEDSRQVGGRPSTFYHIKNAADILADNPEKEEVVGFLQEMVARIRNALVC